ncbi:MAG TPA: putative manganese-dependent inorganic diphosphatase [Verrucomicrobiales bacterium]|nr:putative manganese-dependent inorganic diphosphatase [Verrucomicrobiales bacterium]
MIERARAGGSEGERQLDERPVYVIGHRNPDTDAVCSAIGYAELLRRTRIPQAAAACCGAVNSRVSWVLQRAGVAAPRLLADVRPTARTICRKEVAKAWESETFLDVYQRMQQSGFRSIPVVDEEGRILGMPTALQLLELSVPGSAMRDGARRVHTSLNNIARALEAEVAVEGPDPGQEEEFLLTVGASSLETIRSRSQRYRPEKIVLIVGDRPSVQAFGVSHGVRCIVLTGGCRPAEQLVEEARQKRVALILTQQDTASTGQLIRFSARVGGAVGEAFVEFPPHALVADIRRAVASISQPLFPVVDAETRRLAGVFSKSDLVNPPRLRLVLVDHNEFSQAVTGADEAEILEVLDHHRLSGNLVTRAPVRFINEPVGSTSTIVARQFRQERLTPGRGTAVCLLAGIVSDTLNLTSPTTTPEDREMRDWMASLAELDVDEFYRGFFAAGSVLQGCSAAEALGSDRKEYHEDGWRLSISQIEELGLSAFWPQKEALLDELDRLAGGSGLDLACLMVTDITRNESLLLVSGERELVELLGYPALEPRVFELEGVVSRKKQLFPALSAALTGAIRLEAPG